MHPIVHQNKHLQSHSANVKTSLPSLRQSLLAIAQDKTPVKDLTDTLVDSCSFGGEAFMRVLTPYYALQDRSCQPYVEMFKGASYLHS